MMVPDLRARIWGRTARDMFNAENTLVLQTYSSISRYTIP